MAMDGFGRFGPYVPVAARLAAGRKEAAARAKRAGRAAAPVAIDERSGRDVAWTFWGRSWTRHLERYGDIANRLPRGRTLVRNGSVVDLVITEGRVDALVCGSMLYDVTVTIDRARPAQWKALVTACGGRIDSVVELLAGRISDGVMAVLTDPARGLFPDPKQIHFTCSCPDAARLCKHIAAVLYGVAARLDTQPELLFVLRAVDASDLTEVAVGASGTVVTAARPSSRLLAPEMVAELFGVDWDTSPIPKLPELAKAPNPKRRRRTARS
jgi:uncharacterized Zn finger protein